jgi:hypothetical protein
MPHTIGSQSLDWIAARLWDRAAKVPADMSAALRLWVDRWHVLGFPSFIPSAAWSEPEPFWKAATELLRSKAGLLN